MLLGRPPAELPDAVDAAQPRVDGERDRLTLVRPDGYIGWVGAADEFPSWAAGYFRRDVPPVGRKAPANGRKLHLTGSE